MRHVSTVKMLALQADEAVALDKIAEINARLPDDRAIAECHRRGLFVRLHGIRFALAIAARNHRPIPISSQNSTTV